MNYAVSKRELGSSLVGNHFPISLLQRVSLKLTASASRGKGGLVIRSKSKRLFLAIKVVNRHLAVMRVGGVPNLQQAKMKS